MPPRLPFPMFSSSSDSRAALLQGLMIGAIVVGTLYVAREVLLPLTLAILLSFVLTPLLVLLRKIKVPRVLAVIIVVTLAFAVIFGLGWLLTQQVARLAGDLPSYQRVLSDKIGSLRRSAASSGALETAAGTLKKLQAELGQPATPPASAPTPTLDDKGSGRPVPVEIRTPEPKPLEILQSVAGTVLPPLATAGIVILFVIFILLQREDLRDRLIRLMGASDMQRATATVNDAATRLSGYFVRQVAINASFGTFIALGLFVIGVPSAMAWGILAMLMRFVPYVGSFLAAAPPLLLAAVSEPGWTMALLTGGLFLLSELIMGQVVEPLVYGHGTGLSPIAVILSTVFWTWLWGPLGLLLAMPLTVCLVVLGRHIEALNFLDVLLGDRPALTPAQSFYQRALIGDSGEATYQAELCLKQGRPLVDYLDDVALGGLKLAERDAERGSLDPENLESIDATVNEMMDNLADFEPRRWFKKVQTEVEVSEAPGGLASLASIEQDEEIDQLPVIEGSLAPGWGAEDAVLCIGGRTPLDEAVGSMLAGVLQRQGLKARALSSEAISPAHIVTLQTSATKLVCLSYLGTGANQAHVRYLVRRLRRILPEGATILVGYWVDDGGGAALKALEATAEADAYATSLKEAARICIEAARSHDASTTEAPQDTMAVKDEQPVKDAKAPGKDDKAPAKDKKTAARVA
ncbi:MAG TPA: AI-2E family transporter [Methyloceanibacter sp.]|jgi:predicted PurR-regulated permease PerM|nr:AI-2E family transporter [Methyloceanibacter sp.]